MSNEIWSKKIQGILTLDLSREIRFRDDRKDLFIEALGLKPGMSIVDIGCGPGAITRKLATWLGKDTKVIGIDRDINFITYAKEKAEKLDIKNLRYLEGDALLIPLSSDSVDACISHTVIEHIPNREFLLEQKRICKSEGVVSVMYCRPDKYIKSKPYYVPQATKREIELWEKLSQGLEDIDKEYKVGEYWPEEHELPSLFDELGFDKVKVDAFTIPLAIDDARNSSVEKIKLIEIEKKQSLERLEMRLGLNPNKITNEEERELKELIEHRFSKRLEFIEKDKKIWDYTIVIVQVVSGIVKK
ncbi:MAG: methyltransferase domain-containing protein [Firmicutes bacterium]|nr:methyltransferase domain-containing protein [Bacillota bacterium]